MSSTALRRRIGVFYRDLENATILASKLISKPSNLTYIPASFVSPEMPVEPGSAKALVGRD